MNNKKEQLTKIDCHMLEKSWNMVLAQPGVNASVGLIKRLYTSLEIAQSAETFEPVNQMVVEKFTCKILDFILRMKWWSS